MTTAAEQRFLIECIVTDLALLLMQQRGMTESEALSTIYHSVYYERLCTIETGFFTQSSLYNYHYLCHELDYGKVA